MIVPVGLEQVALGHPFRDQLATACGLADEPETRLRAEVDAVQLTLPTLPPVDRGPGRVS